MPTLFIYVWVKFPIKNAILRVSRKKKQKKKRNFFPMRGLSFILSCIVDETFIEVPYYKKPPLPYNKILGFAPAMRAKITAFDLYTFPL